MKKPLKDAQYLDGQLLIATPQLVGSCFEKSVIYLCAHSHDGAMGLIINQPLESIQANDIFGQLNIHLDKKRADVPVYFGGPVETARGFVLHSADYSSPETLVLAEDIAMTCTITVLKDIAVGSGPKERLLALGYAGWAAGQLETELETNSWLVMPASRTLIFHTDNGMKWQQAAAMQGIDLLKLSGDIGHA